MKGIDNGLNVEAMDFKELRELTAQLYTAYTRLVREINVSDANIKDSLQRCDSSIKATAEDLKLEQSKVTELGEKLKSQLEIAADSIKSNVTSLVNDKLAGYSTVEQTAHSISSLVSRIYDTSTYFTFSKEPTIYNTSDEQKKMLCKYNNTLYYYNSVKRVWEELPEDNEVYSKFIQTENGFEIDGCVSINGDLIVENSITADKIDVRNLSAEKITQRGVPDGHFAMINGDFGDFGIFNFDAGENESVESSKCIFGIYVHGDGAIDFYSYGNVFMGYNSRQKKFYPKGVWDFSSCSNVIGLDKYISSGGAVPLSEESEV